MIKGNIEMNRLTVTKQDVLDAIANLSPAERKYRENKLKPKYHKPILLKENVMTTQELKTKNTNGLVKRTINGVKKYFTPAENFRKDANYRLGLIKDQLEKLGKQKGKNFEYTPEQLNTIENLVCVWLDDMRKSLETPAEKSAAKTEQFI